MVEKSTLHLVHLYHQVCGTDVVYSSCLFSHLSVLSLLLCFNCYLVSVLFHLRLYMQWLFSRKAFSPSFSTCPTTSDTGGSAYPTMLTVDVSCRPKSVEEFGYEFEIGHNQIRNLSGTLRIVDTYTINSGSSWNYTASSMH